MSYDFHLEEMADVCPTCGAIGDFKEWDGNFTANAAGYMAATGCSRKQLDELEGPALIEALGRLVAWMGAEENQEHILELAPSNGWGTPAQFKVFTQKMLNEAHAMERPKLRVYY